MAPKSVESLSEESPLLFDSLYNETKQDVQLSLWNRSKIELSKQLEIALPTLQSMVLNRIPWIISLRFVGEIGAEELAATALATTLFNVTGLSLSYGLSSAMTTLAGQAKGQLIFRSKHKKQQRVIFDSTAAEENHSSSEHYSSRDNNDEPLMPLVFLYRGMLIQLYLITPVGLWWIYGIKDVLIALGQTELLSDMTEQYLRILAPGLWVYSINCTLTAWLQSIGMVDIPAQAAALGLVLHIPFNWFFIRFLEYGYRGSAIATLLSDHSGLVHVFQFVRMVTWKTTYSNLHRRCSNWSYNPIILERN